MKLKATVTLHGQVQGHNEIDDNTVRVKREHGEQIRVIKNITDRR